MRSNYILVGLGISLWSIADIYSMFTDRTVTAEREALAVSHNAAAIPEEDATSTGESIFPHSPSLEEPDFGQLLKCYPGEAHWLISKRKAIKNSWRKNEEKLALLKQDFSQLSELSSKFRQDLASDAKNHSREILQVEVRKAGRFLRYCDQQMNFFQEIRLLELAGDGSFDVPVEMIESLHKRHSQFFVQHFETENIDSELVYRALIGMKYFQQRGYSFLQDMIRHFKYPYIQLKRDEWYIPIPSGIQYTLAVVDFVFNNGWATSNQIRSICREQPMVQLLAHYSFKRFQETIGPGVIYSLTYLSQHWYWPLSIDHHFMKVLEPEENNYIDIAYLFMKIKRSGVSDSSTQEEAETSGAIVDTFSIENILSKLKALKDHSRNHRNSERIKDKSIGHELEMSPGHGHKEAEVKAEVKKLICLLQMKLNPSDPDDYVEIDEMGMPFTLCEVLDLIDREFSPGIIGEVVKDLSTKPEIFKYQYKLILLSSKILQLNYWEISRFHFLKDLKHPINYKFLPHILSHRDYYSHVKKLFPIFKMTFSNFQKLYRNAKICQGFQEFFTARIADEDRIINHLEDYSKWSQEELKKFV